MTENGMEARPGRAHAEPHSEQITIVGVEACAQTGAKTEKHSSVLIQQEKDYYVQEMILVESIFLTAFVPQRHYVILVP